MRKSAGKIGWLHGVIFALFGIVGLPVVLLFFVTAVPTWMAAFLALIDITILAVLFSMDSNLVTVLAAVVGIILVSFGAVALSQRYASTPPIAGSNSIATLEKVKDSEQWISIRGKNVKNPVLLYLAGGPGGSDLAWTRRYLSELENHFVVVNWDQPNSAKSFGARDIATLTPEDYLTDAHALVQHLSERFGQTKIYLMGHSWGSLLGIWLVQRHPDCFHAYVGISQMVDVTTNDVLGYEFALEQTEDAKALAKLKQQGPPPYRENTYMRYATYAMVLQKYMKAKATGEQGQPSLTAETMRAPEYGLIDKVNVFQGALQTFNRIYPQLYGVNLMEQVPELEIPVYFVLGRWDVNVMPALAEQYLQQLSAPHKELEWFEDSAHTPHYEEPAHFVQFMTERVLGKPTI